MGVGGGGGGVGVGLEWSGERPQTTWVALLQTCGSTDESSSPARH